MGNVFEQVERAKQQWESAVDALPELICMVDGEQKIIRANRTLERWQLGNVKEVTGCDFHSVVHADCHDLGCYLRDFLASAKRPAAGEPTHEIEAYDPILARHVLIEMRPTPANQWNEQAAPTLHNMQGNGPRSHRERPVDRALIMRDITEQKRLIHSLERHANRLRTINGISRSALSAKSRQEQAVAAISHLQSFLPVHQGAVFLVNRERSHLSVLAVAQPCHELQVGDRVPVSEIGTISHQALNREYVVGDLTRLEPRGTLEEAWRRQGIVAYASVPLRINGRWMGSLFAGTRRAGAFSPDDLDVVAEVAEVLTVALDQSQLYEQLQATNAELQRMLRARRETVQNLSHELRSPLALIHGFVQLMRDEALGPLTEEQREALSVVGDRGEHLLALIERLLLLQTVGDRAANLEPTDLEALLQATIAPWRLPAGNRGIELVLEIVSPLPPVQIDGSLFPRVVSNLLDNALKFTPDRGTITVRAWSERDAVVIEVADDGQGIPPDLLDAIFDRYVQGDGIKRFQGAGLGLALCREVVRAHGGAIIADSAGENQGSTFTVRLPHVQRMEAVGSSAGGAGR